MSWQASNKTPLFQTYCYQTKTSGRTTRGWGWQKMTTFRSPASHPAQQRCTEPLAVLQLDHQTRHSEAFVSCSFWQLHPWLSEARGLSAGRMPHQHLLEPAVRCALPRSTLRLMTASTHSLMSPISVSAYLQCMPHNSNWLAGSFTVNALAVLIQQWLKW